jgi:hypothetical protein
MLNKKIKFDKCDRPSLAKVEKIVVSKETGKVSGCP